MSDPRIVRKDIVRTAPRDRGLPDLRAFGILASEEEDGSLYDLGRMGELEAIGVGGMQRIQRGRDELLRRALIIQMRAERSLSIREIKVRGARWMRSRGAELVMDPGDEGQLVCVFPVDDDGRRGERPVFWVYIAIAVLAPGGDVMWVRLPGENPEARIQLRFGGDPQLLGAIQDTRWPPVWDEEGRS